jgi:hypothetical protein
MANMNAVVWVFLDVVLHETVLPIHSTLDVGEHDLLGDERVHTVHVT